MPRAEDHVPQAWGLSVQSLQNFSQNGKGTVKANLCCKGNLVCTFAHLFLGFRAQIGRGAGWGCSRQAGVLPDPHIDSLVVRAPGCHCFTLRGTRMGGAPANARLCSRENWVGCQAELGVRTSQREALRTLGSQEALALSQHAWQGGGGPAAHRQRALGQVAAPLCLSCLIGETRAS